MNKKNARVRHLVDFVYQNVVLFLKLNNLLDKDDEIEIVIFNIA